MKVRMVPPLEVMKDTASGIGTVVRAYYKYLPPLGVELVGPKDENFDILCVHAGMTNNLPPGVPLISMIHGLYWTADFAASSWEWKANRNVVESICKADVVTVPSPWVAEAIQRDRRINPAVVPHGIEWKEWHRGTRNYSDYVLAYAKNRAYADVCDPTFIIDLANQFPNTQFVVTFAPENIPGNVKVIGLQTPDKMKKIIQRASCVISPIKETFGILTLEAMASGIPVLGFAHGGNLDLIKHGVTGYLAKVSDKLDLVTGLKYCLENKDTLGKNAQEAVKEYTWESACEKLFQVYEGVLQPEKPTVAVIIPSYNYSAKVGRAIESVQRQDYPHIIRIAVVDDGSPDMGETAKVVGQYSDRDTRVGYLRQENQGVAVARNTGIGSVDAKYICCLDADDRIDPQFIRACVDELEKDKSLGIAYTGLMTCHPDGKEVPSVWPGEFNFDEQLQRKNQIPTCCVFRRRMWETLGGYRQRYAPRGCGSEDAEFWTRAGAYGWKAKQVTEAPLFLYSFGTGLVSGNKKYQEVDWLSLHPWAKDEQHPFPSVATPKRFSHPVRQYDEPAISVIIPVGPGHKSKVFNALDSMEAQSLRKWEAILVDDTGNPDEPWAFDGVKDALKAYPYVRLVTTSGKKGAGYARNRGAEIARAPLIAFLDADDNWYSNDALEVMLSAWALSQSIVYSDYVAYAYITRAEADRLKSIDRLLRYDEKDGLALMRHNATDYDCERAVRQPQSPFYIWNLITSLLQKSWHNEIGGFDEKMPSWEDWDYWIRLAKAGKCFHRIQDPLVMYRFYTGTRREEGIQQHQGLIQYLTRKHEGIKYMVCGCSKQKTTVIAHQPAQMERQNVNQAPKMSDNDYVLIFYDHPNRGQTRVIGPTTFKDKIAPNMIPNRGGWSFDYGYRGSGEEFYVHRSDIETMPAIFLPKTIAPPAPVAEPPAPPPVTKMKFDPQTIPGVTKGFAAVFDERGYDSPDCIIELGINGLMQIDGMTDKRAATIMKGAEKMAAKEKEA